MARVRCPRVRCGWGAAAWLRAALCCLLLPCLAPVTAQAAPTFERVVVRGCIETGVPFVATGRELAPLPQGAKAELVRGERRLELIIASAAGRRLRLVLPGPAPAGGSGSWVLELTLPGGRLLARAPAELELCRPRGGELRDARGPRLLRTLDDRDLVLALSGDLAEALSLARRARARGFEVARRHVLPGLGLVVSALRLPPGLDDAAALRVLRDDLQVADADVNHRFRLLADPTSGDPPATDLPSGDPKARDPRRSYARRLLGWAEPTPDCGSGSKLGMVDTRIDLTHPAFAGARIRTRSFVEGDREPASAEHGTGVAAVWVGAAAGRGYPALLPGAEVIAADVFWRDDDGEQSDAEAIARALDWLVSEGAEIVNLSLGGPRNRVIEVAVRRVLARGRAVVAAAGNSGTQGEFVFPAALREVVAATAIDARRKRWRRATRGAYIDVSAPGVDVWTAAPGGGDRFASGTSFGAPFATAVLIALRRADPDASWSELRERLTQGALDLGPPGRDPDYGWGLVHADDPCATAPAAAENAADAPR